MKCRFCQEELKTLFVSLGKAPLSNAYLRPEQLTQEEPSYPLDVYVCDQCFLVQLPEFETPENIFGDYAYFSSYSDTWLEHVKGYVNKMINEFKLDKNSFVVEVASNDGYLLQYFVEQNIPVLGVEPAKNVAEAAKKKGIPTETVFFSESQAQYLARAGKKADLLLGNNVLAHVPDINDFVKGLKFLLKNKGLITMEFPHLMRLMEETQFDTIYHEHFSYLSFLVAKKIFEAHGLEIFDVEEIPTHGGSLRIYAKHRDDKTKKISEAVFVLEQKEKEFGMEEKESYFNFSRKVNAIKEELVNFLFEEKRQGKKIVGYGAAAKGNTLINYCGITKEIIDFVADRSPHKQGKYLPGSHIPIVSPEKIKETKPDYIFILPWNIKNEIMQQLNYVRDWGAKFLVSIPQLKVFE